MTGKGGVGRSTVACAVGMALAQKGRRVLLLQSNADDRWGKYFGKPAVKEKITLLKKDLYAVNTTPQVALAEYGVMILRFHRIYKLVFENRIAKSFLRAVPGLHDFSILGKAWYHTTENVWDHVIFDMPASGHSLTMLGIPQTILKQLTDGVDSPVTRDARAIHELLVDPKHSCFVTVTLPEEMPMQETEKLHAGLTALGYRSDITVVNHVSPFVISDDMHWRVKASYTDTNKADSAVRETIAYYENLAYQKSRSQRPYLEKLSQQPEVFTVPSYFSSSFTKDNLEDMSRRLLPRR